MNNLHSKKRFVIIGLDGVPYRAIRKLSEMAVIENIRRLIEKGTFKQIESSIPEVSSVAWSSIITGRNPGEHGIFGFTHLKPNSYQLSFPNFDDLKSAPFWLNSKQEKSVIINVPSTYPVKQLDGIHISGFISLKFEKSVYPQSLIPKLKELEYKIDVDSSKAHKSIELFLRDLERTLQARIRVYHYLWQNFDWQIFMLVFTGTDRLGHFLWNAFENEDHKYHKAFLEYFRKIDEVIGEILSNLREEDVLILLSDHGFELLEDNVNINYLLQKEGFLKIRSDSEQNLVNVDSSTKAFALDPARIYINTNDKYPRGGIKPEDRKEILKDLKAMFVSLEKNGRKIVRNAYEREEIFKGPFVELAPDLILVANKGFNLKADIKAGQLYEKNIFTGKHTQDDAFLLINRKCDFSSFEPLSVFKILEIIDSTLKI
jgi:predicted AlkP superfamily phosphohydrolase/phosphomutase